MSTGEQTEALIALAAALAPILLGAAELSALHMIYGPRDRLRFDSLHFLLTVVGWTLIAVGCLGTLVSMLHVFMILWILLGVVVFAEVVYRRARRGNKPCCG